MAFNLVTTVDSLWALSMVSMCTGCEYYGESSHDKMLGIGTRCKVVIQHSFHGNHCASFLR